MGTQVYHSSFLQEVSGYPGDLQMSEGFRQQLEQLMPHFQLLDKASSFFFIFDFTKMQYLFVSAGVQEITGFSAREWQEGGPEFVFSRVVPEDVGRLQQLHQALFDFYYNLRVEDRMEYKYAYDVRIRRKDGTVFWIMQQGSFVTTDSQGIPIVTFDILTDVSSFKKGSCMTLKMFKTEQQKATTLYFPLTGNVHFTKREVELLQLMAKGSTSGEIASQLFLSLHTIKNHRKNMLRKSGARDSGALIYYALENGLL